MLYGVKIPVNRKDKVNQNGNKARMHREGNLKRSSLQVNSLATEDPAAKQKGIDKKGSRTDKSSKSTKVGNPQTLHNQ